MCVPISVLTKGKTSGCTGLCRLWPHISGFIALFAGLIWNFLRGRRSKRYLNELAK